MTPELFSLITRFETRVRQLLLQQQQLTKELATLRAQLADKEEEVKQLREQNEQLKQKYSHLKMAKYIDMADNDVKDMRGRIRTMVRDIDKCISMLKVNL